MKKYLLALCMVLALIACKDEKKQTAQVKPIIRIGAILPLTGDNSTVGVAVKAGVQAAIDDKAKGKLKYNYKAFFEDNQHSPAKSATAANKLMMVDNSNMLLSFTTGIGRVVAPIAENKEMLHMCATLEDENAAPMGKTTFFQGPTLQSYRQLVIKALQQENVSKLVLLATNAGVACSGTEALGKVLETKGLETKVECFNPSDLDFRFVIQKYLAEGFEHFYIQFWPPQSNILLRQLSENNVAPNHIFGSGIDVDTDTSLYNDIHNFGGNSGTPEFIDHLMQDYDVKNVYMAASAYDLISLAIDAFENVKDKNNVDELIAYIKENATRKCMSGDCKLLDNGFIANKAEWRTYKNGKPVFLGD
ncbi:MAG: ABC transporter substrate-binding protein [Alphaproteobacteria bacterium]|nr:ABC transporter substrate-binding protein [Alphaproteobacteria bacterium]